MNHKETKRKHKGAAVTHREARSRKEAPVPGVMGGALEPGWHQKALSSGSSIAVSSGEGECCGQVGFL